MQAMFVNIRVAASGLLMGHSAQRLHTVGTISVYAWDVSSKVSALLV